MPMSSAGIISFSSDMKISGKEIEPKMLIIAALIFVLAIKVATILVG